MTKRHNLYKGILIAVLTLVILATPLWAYNVGDVTESVLSTDIVAYIDGMPIKSYNIKGNTVVVAEDLANYGFNVVWNGTERTLSVSRNTEKAVLGGYKIAKSNLPVGTKVKDVLYTDIVTYLDGKKIESYNIDGVTAIMMDELAVYGSSYVYDNSSRTLKLTLKSQAKSDTKTETSPAVPAETENEADSFDIFGTLDWNLTLKDLEDAELDGDIYYKDDSCIILYNEELSAYMVFEFDKGTLSSIAMQYIDTSENTLFSMIMYYAFLEAISETYGEPYSQYVESSDSKQYGEDDYEALESALSEAKATLCAEWHVKEKSTDIKLSLGMDDDEMLLEIKLKPAA